MNPLSLLPENEATNLAIAWLNEKGFVVSRKGEAVVMSPSAFRRLHCPHLTNSALYSRLRHPGCPAFIASRGTHGRLRSLVPNPDLIAWVAQDLQPGKLLERSAA